MQIRISEFPFFAVLILAAASVFAQEYRPVSVWTASETSSADHSADKMIDGDAFTTAVFLDDSRTGANDAVLPPKGANPVTGTFVLDLGESKTIAGLRFLAPGLNAPVIPATISLFQCDDPEGKQNVRWIVEKRGILSTRSGYSSFFYIPKTTGRYFGVRVDESREGRTSSGWLGDTIRRENKSKGKAYSGLGERFVFEIAEVVLFADKPSDLRAVNPPEVAFPIDRLHRDWLYQDGNPDGNLDPSRWFRPHTDGQPERELVAKVLQDLRTENPTSAAADPLKSKIDALADRAQKLADAKSDSDASGVSYADLWRELYYNACSLRREERLKYLLNGRTREFYYVKHYIFGGPTIIEATENQLDQQPVTDSFRTPEYRPGSQLCRAEIQSDGTVKHEVIIDKPNGLVRDPNLTWDQKTLVFSMRDNFQTENYHLYKMDLASRKVTQITFDLPAPGGFVPKRSLNNQPLANWPESKSVSCSDTEPCVTPNGDIIFSSTRCGNMDICWPMRCANLYSCDLDGKNIRRLGFDQLHTLYPQVQSDGRITYTRWEYNDRTATFLQPLIQMNPDGTSQTEFYGNNSWYPTSIIHARGVPGSPKAIAVISGHHVLQKGKLVLVDRGKGTQEDEGLEFVAGASPNYAPGRCPSHSPKENRTNQMLDGYGHAGPQWNYPFAFDETHYLTGFSPEGYLDQFPFCWPPFGIYYQDADGRRELLAFDWSISCVQPVPVLLNPTVPVNRVNVVDDSNNWGQFYVQNIYLGPGLQGVPEGTIKKIRVIALEYRLARIGMGSNKGPYEHGNVHTPISFNSGSWDVKHVLGEVDVESDGSAYFQVPANVPVYFQCLDDRGRCVQTMRSWATLMNGEQFSCLGCHENKTDVGLSSQRKLTIAMRKPIQKLQPFGKPHPLVELREKQPWRGSLKNYLGVQQILSFDPDAAVEGFSYMQEIQPIWDKHCVRCHDGSGSTESQTGLTESQKKSTLNLTGTKGLFKEQYDRKYDYHRRQYATSYVQLTNYGRIECSPWVKWYISRLMPAMLPPYFAGSLKSPLMDYLESSHYDVQVSDLEKRKVACWIDLAIPYAGSYGQDNVWTYGEKAEYRYFQDKQILYAEKERKKE